MSRQIEEDNQGLLEGFTLPSKHQIGAFVEVNFNEAGKFKATVLNVHFSENRVRYDLEIKSKYLSHEKLMYSEKETFTTRVYNVDSAFVHRIW